ncbi:hypothetical protein D3C87_1870410 [compost metagenome]
MARERVVQHANQLLRHADVQGDFGHQRIQAVLLRQFPQQIGQTRAHGHFAAEEFHAVTRAGFERQIVAVKPLTHVHHIALQRGAADKPFISQIF